MVQYIHSNSPHTKIVLMGVLPRGAQYWDKDQAWIWPNRYTAAIAAVNAGYYVRPGLSCILYPKLHHAEEVHVKAGLLQRLRKEHAPGSAYPFNERARASTCQGRFAAMKAACKICCTSSWSGCCVSAGTDEKLKHIPIVGQSCTSCYDITPPAAPLSRLQGDIPSACYPILL